MAILLLITYYFFTYWTKYLESPGVTFSTNGASNSPSSVFALETRGRILSSSCISPE